MCFIQISTKIVTDFFENLDFSNEFKHLCSLVYAENSGDLL